MNHYFKKGAYIIIALSMLVSCITGVLRIKTEKQYKDLQVAVRYTDVLDVAQGENRSMEDVFKALKDKGATTVVVRENTLLPSTSNDLANWKSQGKLNVYEGYELIEMYPEVDNVDDIIEPELNYVRVRGDALYDDIQAQIKGRKLGGREIDLGERYIEYRGKSNTMATAGMGFPIEDLKIAADMGFVISPQAKAWGATEDDFGQTFVESIKSIPNLGPVYFADGKIPGLIIDPEDESVTIDEAIVEFANNNQIGFIEFFSNGQKGLYKLAKETSQGGTDYKVVRLHTITDAETNKLTSPDIISRYWLAATERNQQVLLFKMTNSQDMDADFIRLEGEIEEFVSMAEPKGYRISAEVDSYNLPKGNFVFAFLSGLASIAVFALFLDLIGLRKLGVIGALIGTIGYGGLLVVLPTMGVKLMALFGASIFPAYAVLWALERRPKNLKETIVLFLQTCMISFGGAITIIGLLSKTSFGLTIDLFVGVKLAHLIPIVLIIGGHIYKEYDLSIDFIKEMAENKVTYLALVIMGLIGVILMTYTSRTGNSGSITDLELTFRMTLDRVLGVRPRTKEFMIGYPLLITLFYYGYKERYLPVLAIAIIGQISLVNTYAHLHTPVRISLIRSAYGIVFGLIIGLIFIYIINKVIEVVKTWQLKEE